MRCLILGKVWPEPTSTAAGVRTRDLIVALQPGEWEVHFASAAKVGAHALDLSDYGVVSHRVQVNDSAFDRWIVELAPDIVVFDRFMTEEQFGWRVAEHCPEALRVLDTSDLHCLRLAREAQIKLGGAIRLANETALREIASIYRSDLTLMISDFEMEVLRSDFQLPEALLAYWPFAVELPERFAAYEERAHFVLIGSFLHSPNLDAARWCLREIWPKLREVLPGAELHCYGSYSERYTAELHRPAMGFHFMGRSKNAVETIGRYRINLAPLRFGAGLKGKVFDGLLAGTPNLMTPIAAEGIFLAGGWSCHSVDSLVQTAVELYTDPVLWTARQNAERAVCRDRFAVADWRPRLPVILAEALAARGKRREANFIGQMLRHHQHRSTEFLSRWIEAKNRA